jgi:hypothetical protein
MKRVAFITDDWETQESVYNSVLLAAQDNDAEVKRLDRFSAEDSVAWRLWTLLEQSDLVILNIVYNSPNIIYEIGLAHGLGKPVIIITTNRELNLPSDLLSQTIVFFENNGEGLAKLKFQISKLINGVFYDTNRLRLVWGPREATRSPEISDLRAKSDLSEILSLAGTDRGMQFENWFSELAQGVVGWEVLNSNHNYTDRDYDFVIWNSLPDSELMALGNPIPVELKATEILGTKVLETLSHKARLQGMKGLIVCTTAKATESNRAWVREFFLKENFLTIWLDRDDLLSIKSSKDLVDKLKSRLLDLIYRGSQSIEHV